MNLLMMGYPAAVDADSAPSAPDPNGRSRADGGDDARIANSQATGKAARLVGRP